MPKLKEVFPGGVKISLDDDSVWTIHPEDVHTAYIWLPMAEIKVTELDQDSEFNYELENTYIKVAVRAMKAG
jgi:hypothetical protein